MHIFISNKAQIDDATEEAFLWCKQNLEFPNPDYTKKQNMGSTKQNLWGVDVQLLNDGEVYMKKLAISFLDRKTEGIEYVQELDSSFDVAEWVTLAKYVRSKYSFRNLA